MTNDWDNQEVTLRYLYLKQRDACFQFNLAFRHSKTGGDLFPDLPTYPYKGCVAVLVGMDLNTGKEKDKVGSNILLAKQNYENAGGKYDG